jgi:colicin import membrane protein
VLSDKGSGSLRKNTEAKLSGVSITEGGSGLDVATVLSGGPEFMARLQQWKEAKDAHDAAYERLGIGTNAAAEQDRAARMVNEAKAEADKVSAEALEKAAKTQKDLNAFVAQARDETTAALRRAQEKEAEADRRLAMANTALAHATAKDNAAEAKLADVNAKQEAFAAAAAVLNKAVP